MNDVKIIYLPTDIWQGVQAMGIAPESVAKGDEFFSTRFSEQDLATVYALQSYGPVLRALGGKGSFTTHFNDRGWDRYLNIIKPLSETSFIGERLAQTLGGAVREGSPPVQVVDLGAKAIGVIMGPGTLDALNKDNSVLTILTAIVQKALFYGNVDALMTSPCAAVIERFVAVNAFANVHRPPSPVYR